VGYNLPPALRAGFLNELLTQDARKRSQNRHRTTLRPLQSETGRAMLPVLRLEL